MIGLIQRVTEARVEIQNEVSGAIEQGILVLLGVGKDDSEADAEQLARRIAGYRIFEDDQGKMNKDVRDIGGKILVVSQFTLVADTRKGRRPSFSRGAHPERANALYEYFCDQLRKQDVAVETGQFAADMKVHLINDGPVTFTLET